MHDDEDQQYYARKTAEHAAKAAWSQDPKVAAIHLELVARYRGLTAVACEPREKAGLQLVEKPACE